MSARALLAILAVMGPMLIGTAQAAGLQGNGRYLLPAPSLPPAPTPAPVAPPVNPGPALAPHDRLSPLLLQPGPVLPPPASRVRPSYPPARLPGPVDQQKTRAYRNDLLGRQRQFDRSGISPADPRRRELQQQLEAPPR